MHLERHKNLTFYNIPLFKNSTAPFSCFLYWNLMMLCILEVMDQLMRLCRRKYRICCNSTEFLSGAAGAQSTKITTHGENCFLLWIK